MESEKPPFDEASAKKYIGKYVLIGITYINGHKQAYKVEQVHGFITQVSAADGIEVRVQGSGGNKLRRFPPDVSSLVRAAAGDYTLKETGEVVTNPDLLWTWEVHEPSFAYSYRQRVIEQLILLSSLERQKRYQTDFPHLNAVEALSANWFEDLGMPDSLKGDHHNFAVEEVDALNRLSSAFSTFANDEITLDQLHADEGWNKVVNEAFGTLTLVKKNEK